MSMGFWTRLVCLGMFVGICGAGLRQVWATALEERKNRRLHAILRKRLGPLPANPITHAQTKPFTILQIESSLREQACSILQPGSVVVKHGGLWSPRPQFESGPGYILKN